MKRRWSVAVVALALLAATTPAWERGPFTPAAVHESLLNVPPKWQAGWLREHHVDMPGFTQYRSQESTGLRMVGKYGRGRAWEVAGQDSLVFMALGSEVAIVDFRNPAQPRLLAELQLDYLPVQVAVRDTLLLTGRNGIDIWSIADPARPARLSHIPRIVSDFALVETLLYFVSEDTFNSYSIARPSSPVRLGFCRDSGYVATATGDVAVLLMRDFLAFVDVTDPSTPRRVGTYSGWPDAATARGNLCCATFSSPSQPEQSWLASLDISDPANPRQLGRLDSIGGADVVLAGQFAFTPGRQDYEVMRVVGISDSAHPYVVGEVELPGYRWGIWADLVRSRCFVASDCAGTLVVDITNQSAPFVDTVLLRADMAEDVWIDGNRAYVADYRSCLKILDISDPTRPTELGGIDSTHSSSEAVAAKDSFAYIGWIPPALLRSVCVTDPLNPRLSGGGAAQTEPEDMVLRDTLLYVAGRLRFNIVNVARPRQPVLVGSCVAGDLTRAGLVVSDTLAYFIGPFDGLEVFSVANPTAPYLVNTVAEIRAAGCDVVDTLLYVGDYDDSLHIWSFANPRAPYQLSSVCATRSGYGVAVMGRYAYVGCDARVRVFDVLDPRNPVEVGWCATPYEIRRVEADSTGVYVCCWEAGVCIFDTFQVGVAEARNDVHVPELPRVLGSVTSSSVKIRFTAENDDAVRVTTYDGLGRVVPAGLGCRDAAAGEQVQAVDLTGLPTGVYFVTLKVAGEAYTFRVVKTNRR